MEALPKLGMDNTFILQVFDIPKESIKQWLEYQTWSQILGQKDVAFHKKGNKPGNKSLC